MNDVGHEVQIKITKGMLDYIILQQLNIRKMHGYELMTNIRKVFGVYFGPSIVYPLLVIMEKKGYISNCWSMESERPRKIYTLTDEGQKLRTITEEKLNTLVHKLTTLNEEDLNKSKTPDTDKLHK